MNARGRFAPSPTGPLHFGSLVAALGSWLHARAGGGEWLVRIEDIDAPRTVDGAADAIIAALAAHGMRADGPVVRQSQRLHLYAAALSTLVDAGHVYACACSRADLAPFGGVHPRACLRRGGNTAWRLRVPDEDVVFDDLVHGTVTQSLRDAVGDFLVRRADGMFTYQLAVVVDDAEQGIGAVVRGADLLDSTPRQILLRRLLGLPDTRWLHLPLVLDGEGRKLAKSDHAQPISDTDPLAGVRRALAFLGQRRVHGHDVAQVLAAAADTFDLAAIPRTRDAHVALRKD